ncbi:MAG TPA: hypothetical protein PLI66_07525 [Spirochaetales bacterium]|nr:hypothetical protein [Spirochaetales bacterium]
MENITPLPELAGAVFRFARGPEDGAALAAIHDARLGIDGVDPSDSYEMVGAASEFEEALSEQLKNDTLCQRPVVEVGREIVAYGKIEQWKEGDGTNVYLLMGWVHPRARGRGGGARSARSPRRTERIRRQRLFDRDERDEAPHRCRLSRGVYRGGATARL